MTNLQAISNEHYADKKWQLNSDYLFAKKDSVCPIILHDLRRVMVNMPVAFLFSENVYTMVAVQGLTPENNLLVDADGAWVGKYIPTRYQNYPFILASTSGDGKNLILCVDESSGLVDSDEAEQAFFDSNGELSLPMQEVMDFLSLANNSRLATERVCLKLQEHNLFTPWTLQIQHDSGTYNFEGLFRVDEEAFNKLSNEVFLDLREAGALPVIYSQLLSMQNINDLADLIK